MTLTLHTLKPARGSKTRRFRVGRGNASGSGTTAGRGTKGQRARTGGRNKLKLKGIKQMLLRIPKNRGFKSGIAHPHAVTLAQLERWFKAGERVTIEELRKRNLVPAESLSIKILNTGALSKKLTLVGASASAEAKKAVEKVGGVFEALPKKVKKAKEVAKKVGKK
jgi:large subunit ribosomal protein L15